jgi:hypothetical protein
MQQKEKCNDGGNTIIQVHNWGIILGYLGQHSWKCVYTIHTSQPREKTHTEENPDTNPAYWIPS